MNGLIIGLFAAEIFIIVAVIIETIKFAKNSPKFSFGRLWMYVAISWIITTIMLIL